MYLETAVTCRGCAARNALLCESAVGFGGLLVSGGALLLYVCVWALHVGALKTVVRLLSGLNLSLRITCYVSQLFIIAC